MNNDEMPSRQMRNWPKLLGWTAVPALLLVIWQLSAMHVNKPYVFPPVSHVFDQLAHPLRDHYVLGSLFGNTLISLLRVLLGFVLAALVGITLGVLMGAVRTLRGLVEPTMEVLRPLCPIAWLPFAIIVFKLKSLAGLLGMKYGHPILHQIKLGMIFVIFVGGFFPILTNTLDGVAGVRRNYLLLARTLGANRRQVFLHVFLPASTPMILTGLRQGIGLCWFVIIAAEMMTGADSGIGYLLMYAADNAAMDIVIAAMMIIGGIGALLAFAMRKIMTGTTQWQGKEV